MIIIIISLKQDLIQHTRIVTFNAFINFYIFSIQAFQGPGFSGTRFFRVWVEVLEVAAHTCLVMRCAIVINYT